MDFEEQMAWEFTANSSTLRLHNVPHRGPYKIKRMTMTVSNQVFGCFFGNSELMGTLARTTAKEENKRAEEVGKPCSR